MTSSIFFSVDARWHFTGGNVHDQSRLEQNIEWLKKEGEKLKEIKEKLDVKLDTLKEAKQAIHSVKSAIDDTLHSLSSLRDNANSVMGMSKNLLHFNFSSTDPSIKKVRYDKEAIYYESNYVEKKISNNSIIAKTNLESQTMANGLRAIANANQSMIKSLQSLGKSTEGLLDIEEVNTEIKSTNADTLLATTKTKANALQKMLQDKIIEQENELAAIKRKSKMFQVTSDPDKRTDLEKEGLRKLKEDSKPGRGFVEF